MTTLNPNDAPLLSADPAVKYRAISEFWKTIHTLLNDSTPPLKTLDEILRLSALYLGADRCYTFSVTTNQNCTSCTNEWVREPDLILKPLLQNIDQRGLKGWLDRFRSNPSIIIEDTENPPADLIQPANKFKRDRIKSIYVSGFFNEGKLIGYLGIDYVHETRCLDQVILDLIQQLASTLNLFILRYETLELWNRTAEALPSALFIKDLDNGNRYTYANPHYLDLFGADILGKDDPEIFGSEIGQLFQEQDKDCIASGQPFRYDGPQTGYSKIAKGYYSLVKFPVATQMGRNYIAGFITDISREHELRMQALELLEQAKSAERAKSLFLAAMSHEIRTPLNAIIGLVDELRHTDIPVDARTEYLASVSSASRALLALINDVLDVSKIEAGQMHMTPVETDLLLLLAECESIFSESCRGKGLSYQCEVSANLPIVLVDTSRLRQILFNLIGNSVKFTPKGGIYTYAKFERSNETIGTLTLEVTDTGIGISEEDQKHVFGMFEQASRMRGTATANKGTGLGLCLCKRLAECMNGEIVLKSELGKGSTFRVILREMPYVERNKASDVVRHRKDQTIRINVSELMTKVLIVDDVPMNLKVLGIILKRMNVEFVAASSASEALEKLKAPNSGITHVLTDIWMPEMNGEELAKRIRANPRWARIKLGAQTADVEASDNFDTKIFNAILSKPLTPEKILSFIRSA